MIVILIQDMGYIILKQVNQERNITLTILYFQSHNLIKNKTISYLCKSKIYNLGKQNIVIHRTSINTLCAQFKLINISIQYLYNHYLYYYIIFICFINLPPSIQDMKKYLQQFNYVVKDLWIRFIYYGIEYNKRLQMFNGVDGLRRIGPIVSFYGIGIGQCYYFLCIYYIYQLLYMHCKNIYKSVDKLFNTQLFPLFYIFQLLLTALFLFQQQIYILTKILLLIITIINVIYNNYIPNKHQHPTQLTPHMPTKTNLTITFLLLSLMLCIQAQPIDQFIESLPQSMQQVDQAIVKQFITLNHSGKSTERLLKQYIKYKDQWMERMIQFLIRELEINQQGAREARKNPDSFYINYQTYKIFMNSI